MGQWIGPSSGGPDELRVCPWSPAPGYGLSAIQCFSSSGPARLPLQPVPCPIPPWANRPEGCGVERRQGCLAFRAAQAGKQVPLPLLREEKLRKALSSSPPPAPESPAYPTFLFSESQLQIAPTKGFPDVSLVRARRPESSTLALPVGWPSLLPILDCRPEGGDWVPHTSRALRAPHMLPGDSHR